MSWQISSSIRFDQRQIFEPDGAKGGQQKPLSFHVGTSSSIPVSLSGPPAIIADTQSQERHFQRRYAGTPWANLWRASGALRTDHGLSEKLETVRGFGSYRVCFGNSQTPLRFEQSLAMMQRHGRKCMPSNRGNLVSGAARAAGSSHRQAKDQLLLGQFQLGDVGGN